MADHDDIQLEEEDLAPDRRVPRRERALSQAPRRTGLRPHERPGAQPIITFRNVRKAFGAQGTSSSGSLRSPRRSALATA